MKIELNRETCIGSATCVGFAPDAFTLTGDGRAALVTHDADGIDAAALEEAVANCPTGSIRLLADQRPARGAGNGSEQPAPAGGPDTTATAPPGR